MPKILEETEITFDRADLSRRSPISRPVVPPIRSSGVHVSGVLRHIAQVSGFVKVLDELDQESLPLQWACGVMWEEFAASMYPAMLWQPGEVSVDDIWMTCDGLSVAGPETDGEGGIQLEEFKFTWKKIRSGSDFLKEWLWIHQGGSYCLAYDSNLVRYHVLYLMGDFSKGGRGFGPVYMRYLVEFSESDKQQIRRMLLANKSQAKEEVNA